MRHARVERCDDRIVGVCVLECLFMVGGEADVGRCLDELGAICRLLGKHRIEIEPPALARALAACARPQPRAHEALESLACPRGEVIAALSVRSAFDLLLTALALPPQSEVMG